MNVAISVVRPFHTVMMANALRRHVHTLEIWTGAPRRFFRGLHPAVKTHLVPSVADIAARIVPRALPPKVFQYGIAAWDRSVRLRIARSDMFVGFAVQSLHTGRAARARGARYVLDRACPHVDFQQQLVREESEAVGARFHPEAAWFRERQLAEYAEADAILVPSRYTANSFPPALQSKLVLAPLCGRAETRGTIRYERNTPFTVGVLGGQPLRKGYLYLLEAWQRLALPGARLLIRSSGDFAEYPRLAELLRTAQRVEVLPYIPDIAEFYASCDIFVLPSVDDGFGMALFEAMANGVPAIATRSCGASELLTDGRDGLVIDPRSAEQIATAIERLYRDEDLRQSLAREAVLTAARISDGSLYQDALASLLPGTTAG